MEFNKPVSNPMLVGTIELLKAEDTPEHRKMFVEELQRGSFLAPSVIEPAPVEDAEGKLTIAQGSKVQFPMLFAPDGRKFFMAFTDEQEFQKWKEKNPSQEFPTFALKFEDYAIMLFKKDPQGNVCPALGFVVNPMGANIVVPREMVASVMTARAVQVRQKAGGPMPQRIQAMPQGRAAVQRPENAGNGDEEK